MADLYNGTNDEGWFREAGKESDVVFSSRMRLSRNLSAYLFPSKMNIEDEKKVQDEISEIFRNVDSAEDGGNSEFSDSVGNPGNIADAAGDTRGAAGGADDNATGGTNKGTGRDSVETALRNYKIITLEELSLTERRILLERNYISQDFSLKPYKTIIIKNDHRVSILINEIDHVRMASIHGGLSLDDCYKDLKILDTKMESKLDYAVSLDLGYLNSQVENCGTGMRVSVMVHLPALEKSGMLETALKPVVQGGYDIKGYMGEDETSLGSMYQISNQLTIGMSEKEIQEKLASSVLLLVDYERKIREDMKRKRKIDMEDAVFRAYGILSHCRSISSKEAVTLLSDLRLGAALGWINLPITLINSLFLITGKAHMQKIIDSKETGADSRLIDHTRALLIKQTLGLGS